jgi:protein-S-isoprenylcysteine O-methyltransferase Ste14
LGQYFCSQRRHHGDWLHTIQHQEKTMSVKSINARTPAAAGITRVATRAYSVASYLIGCSALLYLILFIADRWVPVTIVSASPVSPELTGISALLWNLALVAIWGAQHTIMARPAFKRIWTRVVPAAIERSTYLLGVTLATALLVMFWVPMPQLIWQLSGTFLGYLLVGLYIFGWSVVLFASFLINHFALFGLSQAWNSIRNTEPKSDTFVTPLLYKLVRHPMMTGVLIALWAADDMTAGRLLFNLAMTAYIVIGLHYEERTLVAELGDEYVAYQRTTPKLLPRMAPAHSKSNQSRSAQEQQGA